MRGGVKLGGLVVVLVAALVVGLGVSAAANGVTTCLRASPGCGPPRLMPEIRASITPANLSRVEMAPIGAEVEGNLQPEDPAGMSALREAAIEIDRQVTLDAEGLPSCGARQLVALGSSEARRVCREAIVGKGTAGVVLAPEWGEVEIPVTFFNGGVRDGTTTLLVHSSLAAGASSEVLLARVKVTKRSVGPYGSLAIVQIPPIAAGGGSLRSFSFQIERRFAFEGEKRSYLQARCANGVLKLRATKLLFRNEVNTPNVAPATELTGTSLTPCTPTGSAG